MPPTLNPTFVQSVESSTPLPSRQQMNYLLGRVSHVVLGPTYVGSDIPDPYYTNPADIGYITFQLLQGIQNKTQDSKGNILAKPLNSALKQLPIEGEIVLLIPGPSQKLNVNAGQQDYYYLTPFNLWNASHHNAFPSLEDVTNYSNSYERSYEQTLDVNQSTNLAATQSGNYPLNPSFYEKDNIKTLRPFVGDVTVEGRWGSSIRFGSTTVDKNLNSWSKTGPVGNPITIIRNGQGKQENNIAWFPTVEDINKDNSSLYLTCGQEIVIDDISNNFSLVSLGVSLTDSITLSVPLQQQLTSNDTISPFDQDQAINNIN